MRPPTKFVRAHLRCETLEDRAVPATANLTNGVLTIFGNSGQDNIQVNQSNGQLTVSGIAGSYSTSQVRAIVVDTGDDADTITLSPSVTVESFLYGSSGNDTIQGGSGRNHIYGGNGNDVLRGGSASDELYGGAGSNTVTGPAGATVVSGSANLTATQSTISQRITELVNAERAKAGLPPLVVSYQLNAAADLQARNMVAMAPVVGLAAAMSHTLQGTFQPTLISRANTVGYDYYSLGENIAYGYNTAEEVVTAWMNSAGHRANILNPMFTQIGVSVQSYGTIKYFAQAFGFPQPGSLSAQNPAPGTPTPPPPTPTPYTPPPTQNPTPVAPTAGYGFGPAQAGRIYATGSDAGSTPTVTVYDAASGAVKFTFQAFDATFRGGVRVAVGDVTGDGAEDVIVTPGRGTTPYVKVYNGSTGQLTKSFLAYNPLFQGGVNVAVGDVNGDGADDIITGADAGGGPHVQSFSGTTGAVLSSFFAYSSGFLGGVRVAAGDVNGDGRAEIITSPGAGTTPLVRVFDGLSRQVLQAFNAYSTAWRGGVFIAAGDVDGDGRADIVTGAGSGGGPHVRAFNGLTTAEIYGFYGSVSNFVGGVKVAARDMDGDGRAEIIVGTGAGRRDCNVFRNGKFLTGFLAGDPANLNGLWVG
jgi:uncharacterized protein YkwD